jgi:protease-4
VEKKGKGCVTCAIIAFAAIVIGVFFLFAFLISTVFSAKQSGKMASFFHRNPFQPSYFEEFVEGNPGSKNKIVVIDIKGVIADTAGAPYYSFANASYICRQIKYIMEEKNVKAVILDIDSPGGGVVASDMIHHQIQRLRDETGIPVIALMRSLAASGGYYVAAPCDWIVANRMTLTGSIGVIIQTYKYFDLFKKIGLKDESFTSGKMKDILNGARPTNPAERLVVQKLVNNTYEEFVKVVADGRPGLTVQKIKGSEIGDGRIFDGTEALSLGLVDELGFFSDATLKASEMAKIKDFKVVRYQEPFSFSRLFMGAEGEKDINLRIPGSKQTFELEKGKMYFLPKIFFQ